jgi:hypothetical protein
MENNMNEMSLSYTRDNTPLIDIFSGISKDIEAKAAENYGQQIQRIEAILNFQYKLASHYMWMYANPHIAELPERGKILFSAFHKNLFSFYTALELSRKGFYGAGRPMLRQVFEFLMIAKFCSVAQDDKVYKQWENGDPVYFTNAILKRIKSPDVSEFKTFWGLVCDCTHSTVYSQQIDIGWEQTKADILLNLSLIQTLLECNYHLLNRHLVNASMSYYAHYAEKEKIPGLKLQLSLLFKESRTLMSAPSKKLISSYKAGWQII